VFPCLNAGAAMVAHLATLDDRPFLPDPFNGADVGAHKK
jgi:hypothetical protein